MLVTMAERLGTSQTSVIELAIRSYARKILSVTDDAASMCVLEDLEILASGRAGPIEETSCHY